MQVRNVKNQAHGAAFEQAFEMEAKRADLLPVRNGQKVRWLRDGKMLAVKSNLDWTLLAREGMACFADTKSFQGSYFTYSALDNHQLQLACDYQERGFLAGFVVMFRATSAIVFYSGRQIRQAGARSRFSAAEGQALGHLYAFDLRRIWAPGRPISWS